MSFDCCCKDITNYLNDFNMKKVEKRFSCLSNNIAKLEDIQNYKYKNKKIAALSIFHRSALVYWPKRRDGIMTNEKLEYLGDSLLGFFIAFKSMGTFPSWSEGDLSTFRAAVAGTYNLSCKTKELGLDSLLLLGKGEIKVNNTMSTAVLADLFESVTAAILVDGGLEEAIRWLDFCFQKDIQKGKDILLSFDAKSRFQKWMQGFSGKTPDYIVQEKEESSEDEAFTVTGVIGSQLICSAKGGNKRNASKKVAFQMMKLVEEGKLTQEMVLKYLSEKEE